MSSLHACGKPYYSLSSRVLRTLFPTPVWETGCRGKTGGRKERRNIAFPTRVGETCFGSQYAHSYDFFPTRMGKLMTRPSPAMSSSLRVRGSPLVARRRQNRKLVFPTLRGSSPSRPVPMLLTPPFGRPEASPHAPRARQCCVPVWTGFHSGGAFPARFLLCSLQETAMRNSVGAAGSRFAKEYT